MPERQDVLNVIRQLADDIQQRPWLTQVNISSPFSLNVLRVDAFDPLEGLFYTRGVAVDDSLGAPIPLFELFTDPFGVSFPSFV